MCHRKLLFGVVSLLILITYTNSTKSRYLKIESDGNETPKYNFLPLGDKQNITIFIRQHESDVRLILTIDSTPSSPHIEIIMKGYGDYRNKIIKDGSIMATIDADFLNGDVFREVTIVRDDDRTGVVDRYGYINFLVHTVEPDYAFLGLSAGEQGSATFLINTNQLYH